MDLPESVRSYLATEDALARAQLVADHPEIEAVLADAATRQTILDWLSGAEAQHPEHTSLVLGSLEFLRSGADPQDAAAVRSYTLHPDAGVRLRAFELLLTLYFPDRNREALLMVLQAMLTDADDRVRSAGARYVDRAGAAAELGTFLAGWSQQASARDWHTTESAEVVDRLLSEREDG